MKLKHINSLVNNPVWAGKMLRYFLSGAKSCGKEAIKFELLYLALPLLSDEVVVSKLGLSNSRSTFVSFFKDQDKKERLIGIGKRIASYMELTHNGLIVIGSEISILNNACISINNTVQYNDEIEVIRPYCKAAYNLGSILGKSDYQEIFFRIGATE